MKDPSGVILEDALEESKTSQKAAAVQWTKAEELSSGRAVRMERRGHV